MWQQGLGKKLRDVFLGLLSPSRRTCSPSLSLSLATSSPTKTLRSTKSRIILFTKPTSPTTPSQTSFIMREHKANRQVSVRKTLFVSMSECAWKRERKKERERVSSISFYLYHISYRLLHELHIFAALNLLLQSCCHLSLSLFVFPLSLSHSLRLGCAACVWNEWEKRSEWVRCSEVVVCLT